MRLRTTEIVGLSVRELVFKGIKHISENGRRIDVTAGPGRQAYDVNFRLTGSRNRVHDLLAPTSVRYMCDELIAFFRGSLDVEDGLAQASSLWRQFADARGKIASNYGYYVFHQISNHRTQYEWVINHLVRNHQSRKALININQPKHKVYTTKDFPCAIGAHYFVRENSVCCDVYSRSEDIILGLPYDMAFFSFLTELVCADLNRRSSSTFKLGSTSIKCTFTQIYDAGRAKADQILENYTAKHNAHSFRMPLIVDAEAVLKDIYERSTTSNVMKWIYQHSSFDWE